MDWKYILFHPKLAKKRMESQTEIIDKYHKALYGDRDWVIQKTNIGLNDEFQEKIELKVTCPCQTEAELTEINEDFNSIKYTCPNCGKGLNIPYFGEYPFETFAYKKY